MHSTRAAQWPALAVLALMVCVAAGHAEIPPFFARLTADRQTFYRGESFQLTLAVYSSGISLGRQIAMSGMPSLPAVSVAPFQELANESTVLEGRVYNVRRFRSQARAHVPGELRFAPRLEGSRIETVRLHWLSQTREEPLSIPVEALSLSILDLPAESRPPDFSGAVGQISFSATAAPLSVAVGDLVTVTMTVAGEGLPQEFIPPAVAPGKDVRVYETRPIPADGAPDRRVFEQTVVASATSAAVIPPARFTFFNPRTHRYETVSAGPFPLTFHAERATPGAIYSPTSTTGTPANPPHPLPESTPGVLTRAWRALTGQRLAHLRPGSDGAVRFAPALEAPVLLTLKPGTQVRVDSQSGGWSRIVWADGIGWIPSSALNPE